MFPLCLITVTTRLIGNRNTENVDIFTLFIFLRYSCLSNIRENIYIMKITFIIPHRGSNINNVNINLCDIVNFRKSTKIYTRENIYVHST